MDSSASSPSVAELQEEITKLKIQLMTDKDACANCSNTTVELVPMPAGGRTYQCKTCRKFGSGPSHPSRPAWTQRLRLVEAQLQAALHKPQLPVPQQQAPPQQQEVPDVADQPEIELVAFPANTGPYWTHLVDGHRSSGPKELTEKTWRQLHNFKEEDMKSKFENARAK